MKRALEKPQEPPTKRAKIDPGSKEDSKSQLTLLEKALSVPSLLQDASLGISAEFDLNYLKENILPRLGDALAKVSTAIGEDNHGKRFVNNQEKLYTEIKSKVDEMIHQKVVIPMVGVAGVGKSKLINVIATTNTQRHGITIQELGQGPLPSGISESHVTQCIFSLHVSDLYEVKPIFCKEEEFKSRCMMQKVELEYLIKQDDLLSRLMDNSKPVITQIRGVLENLESYLTRAELIALDEIQVYGPWNFPAKVTLYDTPGWGVKHADVEMSHINILRDNLLARSDVICVATSRLPNEGDFVEILKILLVEKRERIHMPLLVSCYLSDMLPTAKSATLFKESLFATVESDFWPPGYHLADRQRRLTEVYQSSFLFPAPVCYSKANDFFTLISKKAIGQQLEQLSRAINTFWYSLRAMGWKPSTKGNNTNLVEIWEKAKEKARTKMGLNDKIQHFIPIATEVLQAYFTEIIRNQFEDVVEDLTRAIKYQVEEYCNSMDSFLDLVLQHLAFLVAKKIEGKRGLEPKEVPEDFKNQLENNPLYRSLSSNLSNLTATGFADKSTKEQEKEMQKVLIKNMETQWKQSQLNNLIDHMYFEESEEPIDQDTKHFIDKQKEFTSSSLQCCSKLLEDRLKLIDSEVEDILQKCFAFLENFLSVQQRYQAQLIDLATLAGQEKEGFKSLLHLWWSGVHSRTKVPMFKASNFQSVLHKLPNFKEKVLPLLNAERRNLNKSRELNPTNSLFTLKPSENDDQVWNIINVIEQEDIFHIIIHSEAKKLVEDYSLKIKQNKKSDVRRFAPIFTFCESLNINEEGKKDQTLIDWAQLEKPNSEYLLFLIVESTQCIEFTKALGNRKNIVIIPLLGDKGLSFALDLAKFLVEQFDFPLWWRLSQNVISTVSQFHPQLLTAHADTKLIYCLEFIELFMESVFEYYQEVVARLIKKKEPSILSKLFVQAGFENFETKFATLKKIRDREYTTLKEMRVFVEDLHDVLFDESDINEKEALTACQLIHLVAIGDAKGLHATISRYFPMMLQSNVAANTKCQFFSLNNTDSQRKYRFQDRRFKNDKGKLKLQNKGRLTFEDLSKVEVSYAKKLMNNGFVLRLLYFGWNRIK